MAEAEEAVTEDEQIVFDEPEEQLPDIRNPTILNLPVSVTVSIGKAQMTVRELMALTPESVVKLDAQIDDPAEIFIGDKLIARGELVEPEEDGASLGIRLIEICTKVA